MDKVSQQDIDWLMNLGKGDRRRGDLPGGDRDSGKRRRGDRRRPSFDPRNRLTPQEVGRYRRILLRFSAAVAGLFGLVILPFFLLVRTSVWLKVAWGFTGWLALAGGVAATILLLLVYLLLLFRKIQNRKLLLKYSLAGVSLTVLGFCMFSLFYLSGIHAKSPEVSSVYRSMHPILRVAVTTVTLADDGLVITDIQRVPEDYNRMGLPVNRNSGHYRQDSGYVYAVDLRTRDRGFIRNTLLQASLGLMGFRTLRHTGTADHLHVELEGSGR